MRELGHKGYITGGGLLLLFILAASYLGTTISHIAPPQNQETVIAPQEALPPYADNYVVVNLRTLTVELRHGEDTLSSMNIISIGKPGSYYETIGGAYENDYKIRNHYSSIGHVYMPWSVHVFGNFFIHGIPYYASGEKVASTYSGGCIRLSDRDAQAVYDFVEGGTPIIVTEGEATDFMPTATTSQRYASMDMTRTMAAIVSLEVLTQDSPIYDQVSQTYTTRRALLPPLLSGNTTIISTLAQSRGNDTFLMYMNEKARSLGLTNTSFSAIDQAATTSEEDEARFNSYVATYKTYLTTLATTTLK